MNNLIKFPGKFSSKLSSVTQENLDLNEELSILDSKEEDEAIFLLLKEWPCFQNIEPDESLTDIIDRYYDDELTPSQDCVIEFIFHMHDPSSSFDIPNALYCWGEEDRSFFSLSLDIHTELMKKLKEEELD